MSYLLYRFGLGLFTSTSKFPMLEPGGYVKAALCLVAEAVALIFVVNALIEASK